MSEKIKRLTYSALFAAVILLATAAFPISLPFGYVNAGDAFVLLAGVFLGPTAGALSAGAGSALADLFLGYAPYVPATFVIKALMAALGYWVIRGLKGVSAPSLLKDAAGAVCAELVMIGGYFAFESVTLGIAAAAATLAGNSLQGVFAVAVFCVLRRVLNKFYKGKS